jgi:hypothetical protein
MKRFKYIKKHYTIEEQKSTKMPQQLKDLIKEYRRLDISELDILKLKARREHDKERLSAIFFARSEKSFESEEMRKRIDNQFMKEAPSEEMINNHYNKVLLNDLGCIDDY